MPSSTYIYSNYSNYSTYMYFYIDFRSNMEPRYLTSAVAGSPLGCRHCSQEPDYRWISGIRPCLANLSINHRDLMGYHGHIMGGILPGMIDVESGCCPPGWYDEFGDFLHKPIGKLGNLRINRESSSQPTKWWDFPARFVYHLLGTSNNGMNFRQSWTTDHWRGGGTHGTRGG